MALAHRIIPVLLCKGSNLVKGRQFDSARIVGNVYQAASIYQTRGVDELFVLDIGATPERRGPDVAAMRKLTQDCYMPVTVGGGITTVEQVRELLANGADKVAIGEGALVQTGLIGQCAERFGSQAVVGILNYHGYSADLLRQAICLEHSGAGEILLNCIDRDGMMRGYDLITIKLIANATSIPVVPCGGAGKYLHMHHALLAGASAVAAGAMFQWTEATPRGAAEYLSIKGWTVRQ